MFFKTEFNCDVPNFAIYLCFKKYWTFLQLNSNTLKNISASKSVCKVVNT